MLYIVIPWLIVVLALPPIRIYMQSFQRAPYPRKMRILMSLRTMLSSLLLDLVITLVALLLIMIVGSL